MRYFLCVIVSLLFMSCGRDLAMEKELKQIDSLCLVEPEKAVGLLNSIGLHIQHEDEHTLRLWQMLSIKAHDKADMPIDADSIYSIINNVVAYFDKHGTVEERIEAYYYQGRVNHERHDSPRAVKAYLTAIDLSEKHGVPDARIMTNATSQLSMVYRRQEIPRAAVEIALKGYDVASRYGLLDPIFIMDVASGYRYLNKLDSVDHYFMQALDSIDTQGGDNGYAGCLSEMCAHYASVGDSSKADMCLKRMNRIPEEYRDVNYYSCKATYFEAFGPVDSALYYNLHELKDSTNIDAMHDAARALVETCRKKGDYEQAYHYAQLYFQLDDTLKTILRMEQTHAAHNEYMYRRNLEEEAKAYRQANENKKLALGALSVLLVCSTLFFCYKIRAERQLRRQAELIHLKEAEVEGKNVELSKNKELINNIIRHRMAGEVGSSGVGVIEYFRDASSTRSKVTNDHAWAELLKAIEIQIPGFQHSVFTAWPNIRQDEMRIVCLMCIGIPKPELQHVIEGMSRATVYRKAGKAEELLGEVLAKKLPNLRT